MTFRIATAAIILAATTVPLAANAQTTNASTAIVVTAENQRDWDRGSNMEARGLRDLARAERNLVRRSAEVVNLQNRRDTSRSRAENAQRTFEQLVAGASFADGKEAHRWARRIEDVASEWESNQDRMKDADKDLERAMRRHTDAQVEVSDAQSKIDEGRVLMAQAERASRLVSDR